MEERWKILKLDSSDDDSSELSSVVLSDDSGVSPSEPSEFGEPSESCLIVIKIKLPCTLEDVTNAGFLPNDSSKVNEKFSGVSPSEPSEFGEPSESCLIVINLLVSISNFITGQSVIS